MASIASSRMGPKDRSRQRLAAYATVARLMQSFPAAFVRSGPRKPLKLGIHDDLVAAGFATREISYGLGSYCNNYRYLIAMTEGAVRVDLEGRPAGIVTADEAAIAQRRLVSKPQWLVQRAAQEVERSGGQQN